VNLAELRQPDSIRASVRLHLVPLRVRGGRLEVLLAPTEGGLALPGGAPGEQEDVDAAAERIGRSAVDGPGRRSQVGVFGSPGDGLSIVFLYLLQPAVPGRVSPSVTLPGATWREAFRPSVSDEWEHRLGSALDRLGREVEHGEAGFQLVADEFTVSELRHVHEAVRRVSLDPSNFRKRVCRWVVDGALVELSTRRATATRPARLYRLAE